MKKKSLKMPKKKALRLCALGLVLLLLAGAAGYTVCIQRGKEEKTYIYKEETVARGDVVQGVMESGNVSLTESDIAWEVDLSEEEDGDDSSEDEDEDDEEIRYLEIEEVFVVTGQRISQGDPLFSISQESREGVARYLQSSVTEKEIALATAESEYKTGALEAKGTYDSSMLTANTADAALNAELTRLNGEIDSLTSQVSVLELEVNRCLEKLTDGDFLDSLEEARQDYESAKEKYEETDPHVVAAYTANYQSYASAKQQYESLLSQKEEWEETVAQNQETILENNGEILEKQSILEAKRTDAQNTYELNRASGDLASEIYSYTKQSLQESVDSAREEYDRAVETLEELQAFVGDDGIVYADGDGLVTNIYYEAGDRLTRTGTLLSYAKAEEYTVTVDVSEEDIADIGIGDSVRVAFTAYPDEIWSGTVDSITTTKTSDYAATVSYPVEIRIEGDTERLFGGMTAEVTFVTEMASDVLYVSRKAIVDQDGKTYVYVGDGEEKQLREVVTGLKNSTLVEIQEGLSEGDTIYIQSVTD